MATQSPLFSKMESVVTKTHDIWEDKLVYWLLLPMTVSLITFTLYPGLYNLYLGFVEYSLTDPSSVGQFIGLSNFQEAFTDSETINAVKTSLIFILSALILETILGFSLAVLVKNVEHRIGTFYRVLFIIPMAVTPVSIATISRIMLNSQVGIIPYLYEIVLPFNAPNFLGSHLALATIVLIETWQWTPFMFIIFYAGLTSVPDGLIEAARVDGAPDWRIYAHIIIPYLKPLAMVALLIRFIDLSRTFGLVYSLTEGGPGNSTSILPIHIFEIGFQSLDLGVSAAISIVYLAVIIIVCNISIIGLGFKGVWE